MMPGRSSECRRSPPMTKKIQYRAVDVQQLSLESVLERFEENTRIVVGVDVAKRKSSWPRPAREGPAPT